NNFNLGLSGAGQLTLATFGASPDTVIDVSGYYAFPAPITWTLTFRDESNRLSTEYTVGTSISRSKNYFYFGNLLVATRDSAGAYRYYARDHLGTPRLVTNSTGGVLETHKYLPFGQEIGGVFGTQPIKFAAMERDASSGKDYDHARFLSPIEGRFLSADTLQGETLVPQSWNRYVYALNNPLRYVDTDGRDVSDVIAGFANAFASNFFGGVGRVNSDDGDVRLGQSAGDLASIPAGAIGFLIGGGGNLGGLTLDATGVGAVVGIPVNIVSTGLMVQGVVGSAGGLIHLMDSARSRGPSSNTKGLEATLRDHEQRLANYRRDPDAYDNKGFLKGKSEEIRRRIIQGRIRKLERQIENFKRLIRKLQEPEAR
ncbi:MAG TPA: RHS repeat-associated core domain-containing protein, partial [Thermoanaerobaculia bacterium]|nr:RHS repeat-associated core domain-containing protein [Thermoanaerobaculia bacterium]